MKKNMGLIDRVVRVLIALLVAILYFTSVLSGTTALVLLAVSAVFLITSLLSFCPLYWPLRINTSKKK